MKITMGMTTWTEHPVLIHGEQRPVKLDEYAQHFPVVEVDTFFYALPQITTIQNWIATVPPSFQFIVKANQKMTLHERNQERTELEQVFHQYRRVIAPLVAAGQLKTILFQFPPYFDASVPDFSYLRLIRTWLGNLPIAVEFRNQTWYKKEILTSVLDFCRELNFTLVAADEPHNTPTSVPFVLATTNPDLAMLRLHGRNRKGWENQGKEWRKIRTLYRYSASELEFFKQQITKLQPQPKELCVIFNNNSAKDAAPNALSLQKMMNVKFTGLAPKSPEQLDLF